MIKRLVREASFPCVGKLRKGGVRPESGKAPGKDLTYFRFDSDDAHAQKCFTAAYGNEPAQVNVFLPHQTAAANFSCWQEAYVAGGLTHRCDGETCVIWLDNGKYRTDPKPCPGGCKEVGRLMVIIPELQRFAYVTVETHSINDIIRLQENLQAVEFLRGDLRGIPFILKRTPVEISTPTADGKRARREKWLLSIEVDPVWASLQLEAMHRAALTVNGATVDESRMLTTAYDEDEEDEEDEIEVVKTEVEPEPVEEFYKSQIENMKSRSLSSGAATAAKVEPPVQHRTQRTPEPISQPISTGDEAVKLFHKRITAAFAGLDVEDARHWYISQFTDGAAKSTKDLTPAQLSEMAEDLRKFTTLARQKYQEWRDSGRPAQAEPVEMVAEAF